MINDSKTGSEDFLIDPRREYLPNWPPQHRNGRHYVCQNLECLYPYISPNMAQTFGAEKKVPGGKDYVMFACPECTTATGLKAAEAANPDLELQEENRDDLNLEYADETLENLANSGEDEVPEYML